MHNGVLFYFSSFLKIHVGSWSQGPKNMSNQGTRFLRKVWKVRKADMISLTLLQITNYKFTRSTKYSKPIINI